MLTPASRARPVETAHPMSSDEDELTALPRRYAAAVDDRDRAGLLALFVPDAVVVLPGTITRDGEPEVVTDPAALIDGVERFVSTRHDVEQHTFSITGDAASGETSGTAHHLHERHGRMYDYVLALRYTDAFVRTEHGWRFTRRELHVDRGEDVPHYD